MQAPLVEVSLVDERKRGVRLRHTLGFMFLVGVCAIPTEVFQNEEEVSYAKLDSILGQCSSQDTFIVLGSFCGCTEF